MRMLHTIFSHPSPWLNYIRKLGLLDPVPSSEISQERQQHRGRRSCQKVTGGSLFWQFSWGYFNTSNSHVGIRRAFDRYICLDNGGQGVAQCSFSHRYLQLDRNGRQPSSHSSPPCRSPFLSSPNSWHAPPSNRLSWPWGYGLFHGPQFS
jgi:hypothetical protein